MEIDEILLTGVGCAGSEDSMKARWWLVLLVLLAGFGVLGLGGRQIAQNAPPIPQRVVAEDGTVLVGPGQILAGQVSYLGHGGQHIGSILGHGS